MTQTLDHVVVFHILIWDKRKSQINEYSDNNEALHKNTHSIFCQIQNIYSFKYLYKYVFFSHEIYVNLKKESIMCWCCHFILATNILLSFYHMACTFIIYVEVSFNTLLIKNVAKNWALCWEYANFIMFGVLSSTCIESKGFVLNQYYYERDKN